MLGSEKKAKNIRGPSKKAAPPGSGEGVGVEWTGEGSVHAMRGVAGGGLGGNWTKNSGKKQTKSIDSAKGKACI